MALTDAQMTDARRFLGYPLNGTTFIVTNDQDTVYMRFGMVVMSLHTRLTNLSDSEVAVATTYLTTLNTLEAAIPGAGANLDTEQAAVWRHNKNEVADRSALFDGWRRRFCSFIGIQPGPELGSGGISLARG
jgi:hypothetical protein